MIQYYGDKVLYYCSYAADIAEGEKLVPIIFSTR